MCDFLALKHIYTLSLSLCQDKTSIFNQGARTVQGNAAKSRGCGGTENTVQTPRTATLPLTVSTGCTHESHGFGALEMKTSSAVGSGLPLATILHMGRLFETASSQVGDGFAVILISSLLHFPEERGRERQRQRSKRRKRQRGHYWGTKLSHDGSAEIKTALLSTRLCHPDAV